MSNLAIITPDDVNTEALIFKVAAAQFLDVSEDEETSKMKENAVALIITFDNHLSNYTKTIILLRLSEYCRIIPFGE